MKINIYLVVSFLIVFFNKPSFSGGRCVLNQLAD